MATRLQGKVHIQFRLKILTVGRISDSKERSLMNNSTSMNLSLEEAKKRREAKQQTMQDSEVIREESDKTVQALKNAQISSNEALQSLLKDVNAVKNSITVEIQQGVEGLNTLESRLNEWENQLISIQETLLQQGECIQEQATTIHNISIELENKATSFQKATATAEQNIRRVEKTADNVETTFNNLKGYLENIMKKWKPALLLIFGVLVFCVLILIYGGLSQKSAVEDAVKQTGKVMTTYLTNLSSNMENTVQLSNNQLQKINQTMANLDSRKAEFEKLSQSIAAMEAAYSEKASKLSKIHLFEAIQYRLRECSYTQAGVNYGICVEPLQPITDNGITRTQIRLTEGTTPEQLRELKEK